MTTFVFLSTIIVLLCRAVYLCKRIDNSYSATVDDDLLNLSMIIVLQCKAAFLCKRTGWQGSVGLVPPPGIPQSLASSSSSSAPSQPL